MVVAHPAVGAGLEAGCVFEVEGAFVFEVVGEEGGFDLRAELIAGGCAEVYVAEEARGARPLAVVPGAEDHEDFVVGVMRLEGKVFGLRSPHVFLVPPAAYF